MRRGGSFFVPFAFLPLLACASAAPSTAALERRLDDLLAGAGGTVAVAYHDLGTGATVLRDARLSLHAAST
ncbi:MAG TPA: hypothetical protein VGC93_01960, partial [Thermoanaerobaculia bacterium]